MFIQNNDDGKINTEYKIDNRNQSTDIHKKHHPVIFGIIFLMFLLFLSIIIIKTGSLDSDGLTSNKPITVSPVDVAYKFLYAETCLEFDSYLSNDIRSTSSYMEQYDEMNKDIEKCDRELKESKGEEDINVQCKETNVKDIKVNSEDLKIVASEFSKIVLCNEMPKNEDDPDFLLFLSYDKSDMVYKIEFMTDSDSINSDIKYKKAEAKEEMEAQLRKNTTNPAYKKFPNEFITDEDNIITNLPDDNKSVWVEKVIDENTILVSYIILRDNENIITFATIDLYGLRDNTDCREEKAVEFLKIFIEHKYVYLDGGYNSFSLEGHPDIPAKLILKFVKILKEDVSLPTENINNLYGDENDTDMIDVNTSMVSLGFASVMFPAMIFDYKDQNNGKARYSKEFFMPDYDIIQKRLENIGQVAKIAKRGFWADGVCE